MKTLIFGVIVLCMIATFGTGTACITSQPMADVAKDGIIDYEYEDVPIEEIQLTIDGNIEEIQPRQTFNISYILNPWYTTTKQVYVDIFPQNSATVTSLDLYNKTATIEVAGTAEVGGNISVTVSADNATSNAVAVAVVKIPVENISLAINGDVVLHKGRYNSVTTTIEPSYATNSDIRYEVSGSGLKYIETFNTTTGEIKAKDNFDEFDVGSTVTITAIALDNESITNSVTLGIVIPTVSVDLSATTPRNALTADNKPLAVAASGYADIVTLNTLVNGVNSFGLNYVIVSGQEYIKNGAVKSDGSFELKKTTEWSNQMKVPHAEIKLKVAYSDGFDEIIISIYVPVESYSFKNSVPSMVENYRDYNFEAIAFPHYATHLADNDSPLVYSLNDISSDIATVDNNGMVSLPKSLTSKNTVINFATFANGWEGVDAIQLEHSMTIIPVYATAFDKVSILKNGREIDPYDNRVLCEDVLDIEIIFNKDNVTDLTVSLGENSNMISVVNNKFVIANLTKITNDNPILNVGISYSQGGNNFVANIDITIYVEAKNATISNATFERGISLDLNPLITINGHGFASDKTIIWGNPTIGVVNGQTGIVANLLNGRLNISSQAHAGTVVKVPYKTVDGEWQEKIFTVASLNKDLFTVSYGADKGDGYSYNIKLDAPQLEEGHTIDLYLKYAGYDSNGLGASSVYGVSYIISSVSNNATLTIYNYLNAYDCFRLGAKSGESGKDNLINYTITIIDGNARYTVSTNGYYAKSISIFNRISGSIGVENAKILAGEVFKIADWDGLATFDSAQLKWSIAGKSLKELAMIAATTAFTLNISAVQKYNDTDIVWNVNIVFSLVSYKDGDNVLLYVYKKNNATITIEGSTHIKKDKYTLKGWDTSIRGDKKVEYGIGKNFAGNEDFTLWACWTTEKGENYAGTIAYNGSDYSCIYNVYIASSSVDGNNYNSTDFNVRMLGISCVRNAFTTFHYKIDFTITKDSKPVKSVNIDFKIVDKDDVPKDSRSVFGNSQLAVAGDYTLSWSGKIQSNVTAQISGSYNFRINCN